MNMQMDKKNFNITGLDLNYDEYSAQTLRNVLKYTLNLTNIPISYVTDSSYVYKISGTNCSQSMTHFNYNRAYDNFNYMISNWNKDSYILVELKK